MSDRIDAVATARRLAAEHPDATLGCPACDASLKAANLDRHLGQAHPGLPVPAPTAWRSTSRILRGQLALVDGHLELTRFLRLRRRVPLLVPWP